MSSFGRELIESLKQAAKHARGERVPGMRTTRLRLASRKAKREARRLQAAALQHPRSGLRRRWPR